MKSLMEKISGLEGQLSDLAAKREEMVRQNALNAKARSGQIEIEKLDAEIKAGRDELQSLKVETARLTVKGYENEAAGLLADLVKIDVERRQKISRFLELEAQADAAIPRRRIQMCSKRFLRMERWIPKTGIDFTVKGVPLPREGKVREEELVSVMGIKEAEKLGWKLVPGQPEPPPEELDASNSQEVRVFEMPRIFENIPPEDFVFPVPIYIPLPEGGRYGQTSL